MLVLQDTYSKHEDSRSLAMLDSTMPYSDRCTDTLLCFRIPFLVCWSIDLHCAISQTQLCADLAVSSMDCSLPRECVRSWPPIEFMLGHPSLVI